MRGQFQDRSKNLSSNYQRFKKKKTNLPLTILPSFPPITVDHYYLYVQGTPLFSCFLYLSTKYSEGNSFFKYFLLFNLIQQESWEGCKTFISSLVPPFCRSGNWDSEMLAPRRRSLRWRVAEPGPQSSTFFAFLLVHRCGLRPDTNSF